MRPISETVWEALCVGYREIGLFGDDSRTEVTNMVSDLLTALAPLAENAAETAAEPGITDYAGAALAVGLAALGSGYAERGIGAAAVGAVAEDDDMFVRGLIFTVLPETLVIFALLVVFLRA